MTWFRTPHEGIQLRNCPECEAAPNTLHEMGCNVERCCLCGEEAMCCYCVLIVNSDLLASIENDEQREELENNPSEEMYDRLEEEERLAGGRLPWTGEWPGISDCRELNLWCYEDEKGDFTPCAKDHPGACEDLLRLASVGTWDKQLRKWVIHN